MQRRNFIRLVGGGVVVAATVPMSGCSLSTDFPSPAVEAWRGPQNESDPRRRALAYAITAPNPHNLQPWLVDLRESGVITVMTDRERVLPHTDPLGRQILIGHGAFIELLVIALASQGVAAEVALWPQGELGPELKGWDSRPIARLTLKTGAVNDPLFAQVLKRHTPKSDYDGGREVSAQTLSTLMSSVTDKAIRVGGTVSPVELPPLRELCVKSAQIEFQTPRTVMETLELLRVGPDEIVRHRDGLPINTWMARALTTLGLFDRSAPPPPGSQAFKAMMAQTEGQSRTAMGFVWLSAKNARSDQVHAGRAYVRLQLKATEMGLGVHPMSQALQEFPEMAPSYARAHQLMLKRPAPASPGDETLQMFCRLGYTDKPVPATPRRPLESFVRT
jgi:nitroreductase